MIKKLIKNLQEDYKILMIRWICQRHWMCYDGRFYFPGGFATPDIFMKSEAEKERERQEKMKDWSPYRRLHGYEEGSYMDKIMKKYGGIDDIMVSHNADWPKLLADFHDFRYRRNNK